MYIIHEGVPGSGKSYDAVKRMLDVLKGKRVVYTNIDGVFNQRSLEAIAAYTGLDYSEVRQLLRPLDNQTQVKRFWEHCESGSYIIIDEAQLYWNSRDYQLQDNKDHGAFASTHRHQGYDVLLITQRAERIDSALRALCEWRYRYRKLNFFGGAIKASYLCYSFNGDDPKVLNTRKGTYDKRVFLCYSSYVGDASEKSVRKPPNILNHPIFYGLGFVLISVVYLFSQSGLAHGDIFGAESIATAGKESAGPTTQPQAEEGGATPSPGSPVTSPPGSPATAPAVAAEPSKPPLVVLGYINGKPVYRHEASGRVIVSPGIPRISPTEG